jgi:hypothetical protein
LLSVPYIPMHWQMINASSAKRQTCGRAGSPIKCRTLVSFGMWLTLHAIVATELR